MSESEHHQEPESTAEVPTAELPAPVEVSTAEAPAPVEAPATEPAAADDTVVEAGPAGATGEHEEPVVAPSSTSKLPPAPPPSAPHVAPVAVVIPDAGKIVGGSVTAVDPDELAITLDDGRPAVLARRHWDVAPTEDLTKVVTVNDHVEAAILARDDPKKRVVLSRSWALKTKAWGAVTEAVGSGATVSGKVTSIGPKGIVVDVGGLRGFVPASHIALESTVDLAPFADQVLELKVLEADPKKERLVLSRRSILLREQRKDTHELLSRLKPDQVVSGTVASLSDYGAFIDLGGVKGLVHISELSWQRVRHPRDVVAVGDEVQVRVIDVKIKKRRVSLSLRQAAPDPLGSLEVGSVVVAPVTRLVDFGAFVDLGGVEGLVHLSEMAEYRVSAPEEIVTPGETVPVKILSVDRRRRRIELSIRQAVSDQYGS